MVEQEIGQPITEFEFCATVEIVGAATDPVPANNTICLMVARGAEAPTSISEIGGNMVSIYPNPATSVINIDNAEGAQIALFDINGKMVYSVEHAAANQQISTEGLTQGLYIARIISGNDVVTKKINVVR